MIRDELTIRRGFTSIELLITMTIMVIPILVVGFILADSNRGWHIMYNRINSDVVADSYVAAKAFDALVRRASQDDVLVDDNNQWVEVCYCQDSNSVVADRYALFYVAEGDLIIEYGQLEPKETMSTRTVCQNVSDCAFKQNGQSLQMILTLDNGTQTNTVVSSAVMHN
jgi:Tfp pilus assembly protein FimT